MLTYRYKVVWKDTEKLDLLIYMNKLSCKPFLTCSALHLATKNFKTAVSDIPVLIAGIKRHGHMVDNILDHWSKKEYFSLLLWGKVVIAKDLLKTLVSTATT